MAKTVVTTFVSDVSGKELKEEEAVRITVTYPDDRDHMRVIDCTVDEAKAFADKGTVVSRRGRKKDAAAKDEKADDKK